jgi:hypothetical protein
LTRLLSHHPHPTPRSQSRTQLDRRPGCLRARCNPQGDTDHQPKVRRRPRVFAFLSMPIDMPALSPYPLCSSLTAWIPTASLMWASRPSKTPRAAASASHSSKWPRCATPPPDASGLARPTHPPRPHPRARPATQPVPIPPPALSAPSNTASWAATSPSLARLVRWRVAQRWSALVSALARTSPAADRAASPGHEAV